MKIGPYQVHVTNDPIGEKFIDIGPLIVHFYRRPGRRFGVGLRLDFSDERKGD